MFHSSITEKMRAALAIFLLAAMMARGFIPAGYMPDTSRPADAPATMAMCDGMGPMDMAGMKMPSDPAPAKKGGDQKIHDHAPCPFSVNAVFASAANVPQFSISFAATFIIVSFAAFAFAQDRRFGNAAPRAPPLSA